MTQQHYFTVDVEEYFQVSALESEVRRSEWDSLESRVADGVGRLLEILDQREARGTFFVLGWIAKRHPGLVRRIAEAGHEVASHGWDHRRVNEQTPEAFREAVRCSRRLLEEIVGRPVLGYRAPSFSIVPGCEWAFDVLLEEGYRYDSSLFPVRRPGYGYPAAPRHAHWVTRPSGRLLELPPATLRRLGINIPAGGGAYFRLFPYPVVRAALREAQRSGVPGTFYIHPWELDPDQPRLEVPLLTRLRHYGGLEDTAARLDRLLGEFHFTSVARTLAKP